MITRFDGFIAGLGTAAGLRVVVGHWPRSPFGAFTDVMVERPDGHRLLLAPSSQVADFVAGTYTFDKVRVGAVSARTDGVRWTVDAAPLALAFRTGPRLPLGRLLRLVPRRLATAPRWIAAVDAVARRVLPGVRTRGSAGGGREEFYGALAPVDPPVRFGFGSTPRRPSLTRVPTLVRTPDGAAPAITVRRLGPPDRRSTSLPPTAPARVRPLVLTDVTVVDTRDGSRTPHRDVHLVGGRIAAVGAPGPAPDGAEVVAGAGRHLVPGYVDMHGHPLNSPDPGPALELMLAHGITGFRQMAGTADLLRRRRVGTLGLPERSPALLAMPGEILQPTNAATAGAAVATISRQAADGADFIKAALITPEVLAAIQREAARLALPVVGHLPIGVDVREASRAGLRCVEHLGPGVGILSACSTDEAQVRAAALTAPRVVIPAVRLPFLDRLVARLIARLVVNPLQRARPAEIANLRRAVTTFTDARARELARRFAADGTWQCPTLIRLRTQQMCDSADFRDDPDLRYVSARTTATWERAARAFSRFSVRDHLTFAAAYRRQLELVRIFDEEGVPLLAGSDCVGAAWVIPGPSLHREFDELGSAGLSPLAVLQATTLNAARFLGREADHGTVEPGRAADLVLLDADPTADVQNLHRVSGVVRAGRHYPAADLDAMKAAIAAGPGVD